MERTCAACGEPLSGDRRRKYCDNNGKCKMRFHRGARAKANDRVSGEPAGREGIESTEAATMLVLAEAGKLGTPSGQAALVLARRIDRSHLDTGSGLASMVKRLQETIAGLTSDVKEDSPLDGVRDELAQRRERRGA